MTGLDRAAQIAGPQSHVSESHAHKIITRLKRRLSGEPLDNIFGYSLFYGRRFDICPDVLSPRPETEILVDHAVGVLKSRRNTLFLELGVGSGAIIVSCLAECSEAKGVGVDLSETALEITQQNARRHHVESRLDLMRSHWFENVSGTFDLIVSNPPYITDAAMASLSRDVSDFDPDLALRGGTDGLNAYREIILQMDRYLKPNGNIIFEIGYDQGRSVYGLLERAGFAQIEVIKDYSGHDRVIRCISEQK